MIPELASLERLTAPLSPIGPTWEGSAARPRLVIAHPDASYLSTVSRHFRRLGWHVEATTRGDQACRLAFLEEPAVVILATDLPDESGWLVCRKLRSGLTPWRIVLVHNGAEDDAECFARFVGADTLLPASAELEALIGAVYDRALAAVG